MSRTTPKPQGNRTTPKTSTVFGPGSPPGSGGGTGNLFDEEHVAVQTGVVLNSELEVGEALAVQTDVVLGGAIEVGEALAVQTDVVVDTTLRETLFEMNDDGGLVANDLATGGAGNPHAATFNGDAHVAAMPANLLDSVGRPVTGSGWLHIEGIGFPTPPVSSVSFADHADFNPAGDFTIEFFSMNQGSSALSLLSHYQDSDNFWDVVPNSGGVGNCYFQLKVGGTILFTLNNTNGLFANDGRLHHICVQKSGTTYVMSVDGVVATVVDATAFPAFSAPVRLGEDTVSSARQFMKAIRWTDGSALYGTSNFDPPKVEDLVDDGVNTHLLVHFGAPFLRDTGEGVPLDESTGGVDSPRPLTLQGLGAYFEDHDGYQRLALRDDRDSLDVAGALVIPDSDDLRPVSGTGDYCIEAILEVKRDVEDKTFLWHGIATDRVHCHLNGSGNLAWDIDTGGGSDLAISGASGWSVGDKVHVVFEKVGSDYTIYSDGAQIATGVNATAWGNFGGSAYAGRLPITVPGNRGDFDLFGYRLTQRARYGETFDTGTPKLRDDSGQLHHGLINGTLTQVPDGVVGASEEFDGGSDAEVANDADFETMTSISIAVWINLDSLAFSQTIISLPAAATWVSPYARWGLRVSSGGDGRIQFWIDDFANVITGTTVLSTGVDYHIVATWDGSDLRIYLDGVLEAGPQAFAGSMSASGRALVVGQPHDTVPVANDYFNGRMSQLAVFRNRVLSLSEVQDIYDEQNPAGTGLKRYFPKNGSSTGWFDMTSNVLLYHMDQRLRPPKVVEMEDDENTVLLWKGGRTQHNHGRWGAYGVGGINTGTPVADPYGGSRRLLIFDGIDDYVALLPPYGSDRLIRRGKHGAIDLWIYPTSSAGALRVVAERLIDASNFWVLQQETDDSLTFIIRSSGVDIINVNTGASSLNIMSWNHITVDFHDLGGVAINGTFVGLETTLGAVVTSAFTSQPIYLGVNAIALGSNLFEGYMADLRYRSGTSPYLLTDFTAPSAPPS